MKRTAVSQFFVLLCVAVWTAGAKPSAPDIPDPVLHHVYSGRADGTSALDSSGLHNDGRIAGKPEYVEGVGKKGWAVRLDGLDDCIRVPRSASLEPDVITVAVWLCVGGRGHGGRGEGNGNPKIGQGN